MTAARCIVIQAVETERPQLQAIWQTMLPTVADIRASAPLSCTASRS